MRKALLILALIFGMAGLARAQQNWTLSAAAASCTTSNGSCLIYLVDAASGGATFTVTANASGNTLAFEATGDGGKSWVALSVTPSNSTTTVTSTTSTGTWQANVAAYTGVRIRMSTLVSGTATVSIITSLASARSGGGGAIVNGAGSNPLGASLNVKAFPYSAVGNGKFFIDGVTNAGNTNLTSATAGFTASDVGQLASCINTPNSVSVAQAFPSTTVTITGFVNSTTVTYSGTTAGTKTSLMCSLLNPADPTAILNAFNACKSTTPPVAEGAGGWANLGCNIYIPPGIYGLSNTLSNIVAGTCVGITGDAMLKTVLIPTAAFAITAHANGGWFIDESGGCSGGLLKNFTIETNSLPINAGGGASNGVINFTTGNSVLEDVQVFDQCVTGGVSYGIYVGGSSNIVLRRPVVISSGNCGSTNGGLGWVGSEGDVFAPFLSNTQQNLQVTNQLSGSAGAGVRFWGGLIDEGSITTITNSIDVWFEGTTLTGGANCVSIDATSYVWFFGGYCGTFGGNTGSGPTVASGGVAVFSGMHVNGVNATSYCWNSVTLGGIIDDGGNRCSISGGATFYKTGSAVNLSALTHSLTNFTEGVVNLASSTIGIWTPDQALNVTRIQASNTGGNVTCATPLVLQLANGTTTQTLTLTSGQASWDSGVITGQYAAGTAITLSQTAAGACAVPPVNLNVSILWNASQGP